VNLKAIVFDLDGTLLESAEIKTEAFGELFREYPQHRGEIIEYHLAHEGVSRYVKFRAICRDILKQPLDQAEEVRLGIEFSRLIAKKMAACPLVSGARAFLERVAARYKCFIASGTPHEELCMIVAQRGIEKYFSEWHGAPWSKEDVLRGILERHALIPLEVLCIGDSMSDLQAARAVRVPFVGRAKRRSGVAFPDGTTVGLFHDFDELLKEWSAIEGRIAAR